MPVSASWAALVNWLVSTLRVSGPKLSVSWSASAWRSDLLRALSLDVHVLVVVAEGHERRVGDVVAQQLRGGAQQCVADAEVRVEERERPVGVEGFQPQRHLGDLDGQVVEVHAVDAAFDDVGGGGPQCGGRGFGVAGAHGGQRGGDPAGGGDDEMPTAAGGVDDGEVQQRLFGIGCPNRLVDQRVQRLVEHQRDQFGGRVVGAGLLAVVAGGHVEGEGPLVGVVARRVGEQSFVHAAEFLAVEVAVVDRARAAR